MGKLKGFKSNRSDSLAKRAAAALAWLARNQKGAEVQFISWPELYAELTGVSIDDVNQEDVIRRLRRKGHYVKAFLRESGFGWAPHPGDRSLIRATTTGEDSARYCVPYYQRRARNAAENFVNWTDKTVGDPRRILRTKDNERDLASLLADLPKFRALMATAAMPTASSQKAKAA